MVVWGALGVTAGKPARRSLKQGNYMSQYETGYGASVRDGGGTVAAAPVAAGYGNCRGAPVVSFENVS